MQTEIYQLHKITRMHQTYLSKLIWYFFYNQRSYQQEISEKTTTVQTI